jgi:cobalt-zinc-cadmium efflux system membrane fusion protein
MKAITNRYILLLFSYMFIAASCNSGSKNEGEEKEHHEEASSTEVGITEEQYKAINLQLGPVEKRNLHNTIKANGVLNLPPQNKANVSSMLGGKVQQIYVIEGDRVKKGQKLALIENPEYLQLQQDYLEAKSNFAYAEKDYLRQKELYKEKVVAQKKFQQAEADYNAQKAMVSALENRLNLLGISPAAAANGSLASGAVITAPIDGYINKIKVNTGSYVEPQSDLLEVVDNSHIHIDINIYQADLPQIKEGQKVYFTLSGHEDEELEATIFATGKAFDNETKSVTIHAEIKDNKRNYLLPGMFVDARINIDTTSVNALPEEAIISEGDMHYIFVKTEGETHSEGHKEAEESAKEDEHEEHGEHEETKAWYFEKVQVRTGISDLGYVEIIPLKTLPPDAQVVIKGAYYLAAEMKKAEGGDEEHGH